MGTISHLCRNCNGTGTYTKYSFNNPSLKIGGVSTPKYTTATCTVCAGTGAVLSAKTT